MGYTKTKKTTRGKTAAKHSFRKKNHGSLKSKNDDLREKLDRTFIEGTALHTVHGISNVPQSPNPVLCSQSVDDSLKNITAVLRGL